MVAVRLRHHPAAVGPVLLAHGLAAAWMPALDSLKVRILPMHTL